MRVFGVSKAVIRRKFDGKYLVLRGSKWEERPDRSQKPDLPGGVVEEGETVEQGCVREIFEETGITIEPSTLTLAYAHSFVSEEDSAAINRLIYFVEIEGSPEVKLSWEHEGYWWMTADEVLELDIRNPYPEVFQYMNRIELLV